MNQRFTDRTAIVTGAAGGIGLAIARTLAAGGANVVVADLDEAAAKSAADILPRATAVACDVRDEDQVQALVATAVATYGGLHLMVPNAGVAGVAPIIAMDLAEWRRVTSVNLDGVFLSIRYAAPAIIASGGGSIVTVASVTATAGTPLVGAYAAAKAGVVNLTKTAATELRDHGVRVNAVLPGFVETPLVTGQVASFESILGLPEGGFAGLIAQKQGRFGTVEEVANAVAFLASDEASFCSGSGLVLDGGLDAGLF
ncbi:MULTISPECIES: SDR family NAD(P)-dependent oxidoreductase [unclassified Nocardioides]|uniref:SDR family NAD(P)-dependent oxidoreductase n=1 Tax=unclassified Nocardioides TaxID=2615069 RepID=UPI0011504AE4|nr:MULTISPECIES: glucose 1-dehydrogenase [unclassified Nocardioides]TQK69638.1 NAD(P)-dependent dehydrogenase (short-subunit alcohol dehydrogenase family) [Nocardioides sp. SLBN-35]WGY01120.1 glucose 1-dehydrogenase [Nocardioides sp. QY071]